MTLFPASRRDPLQNLAEAIGLSISISTLLALVAFFLGVVFSPILLACFYGLSSLVILVGVIRRRPVLHWNWSVGVGLVLFAGLLAWRFYQAHDLVLPPWVDSVHHVLAVQRILQTGGIPVDFGIQLPVPFFYHYGFHLLAALYAALAGFEPAQAVLWMGQILNAAVSLSVFRLTLVAFGERRTAALAGLLVGFVLQMPAYDLAWGRFTLVAGLVLLPLGMASFLEMTRQPGRPHFVRLALLTAGLCLTHYLLALLFALFMLVTGIFSLASASRQRQWRHFAWQPATAAGAGLLLALPWIVRLWLLGSRLVSFELALPSPDSGIQLGYLLSLLGPFRNHLLLAAAVPGLVWAFFRPGLRALAGWTVLLVLFSLPWGLRLNPFRPDQVVLVLFLPAALLLAGWLSAAGGWLERRFHPLIGKAALGLLILGLAAWGMQETAVVVNQNTILATRADLDALAWVKENTPVDARFLINTVQWQTGSYRGVDGGYWLLPLTGRQALLPPAVYGWGSPGLIRQVNDWAARAAKIQGCGDDFWSLVNDARLDYIYLKRGRGNLQPEALAGCAGIQGVYDKLDVFIYEIDTSAP